MIPKNSTPIKNEILIEILAKGLLGKNEIRIMAYIIRWSWGFNGKERRQDWTRPLRKRKIAGDIGMDEGNLNTIISKMVAEKKVLVKDGNFYQFNEHYEDWRLLISKRDAEELVKLTSKTCYNNKYSDKKLVKVISSRGEKVLAGKGLSDRKENKYKDNVKDKASLNYIFAKEEDNNGGPDEEAMAGGWYAKFPKGYNYVKEDKYFSSIERSKDKIKAIKDLIDKIDNEECERLVKMTYKQWDEFKRQYPNGGRERSELYGQIVDIIVAKEMAEAGM